MTQISVFQTIQTKYIAPSNFRGARIKAKAANGKVIVVSYDHGLNVDENHAKAAETLQEKMQWTGKHYGELIGGQNADGSYTWIMTGTCK